MIDTVEKKSTEKQDTSKKEQNVPQKKKYRFTGEKIETVKIGEKTYMLVPNRIYVNVPDELLKQMKDKLKEA